MSLTITQPSYIFVGKTRNITLEWNAVSFACKYGNDDATNALAYYGRKNVMILETFFATDTRKKSSSTLGWASGLTHKH